MDCRNNDKGFTLVEIIVSIALLGIIALFMLPMSMYSVQYSRWNNIKLTAMNLAYTQLEWLKTLDYNTDLGIDEIGYSPKGKVKQHLYLNQAGSDPKTIEGIEYRLLTSIYWQGADASTGEFIANATKKADVTVKARNPISGTERSFQVIGTLIAFEGERPPFTYVPLKVRAITGEDFTSPAKNVKIVVNNLSNTLVNWSRTDEAGEAMFTELSNGQYYVFPQEWEEGDMMSRPTGTAGPVKDEDWVYQAMVTINATTEDYIEQQFFVDNPAYIKLEGYPDIFMSNTYIKLDPIYDPPEGDTADYILETSLKKLLTKKIWRYWGYEYSITNGTDNYFFVETDSGNLWNGRFQYIKGSVTTKQLKLAYGLKEGSFKQETDGTLTLSVEFTSGIKNHNTLEFSLYDGVNLVGYTDMSITPTTAGEYNTKFLIRLKPSAAITGTTLRFEVDNKNADTLINSYGMKLVQNGNYCSLIKK